MQDTETNGKQESEGDRVSERIPASEVRDRLTELMNRARFGGERFVLTRNGEDVAAIIGSQELASLSAA
jgi:prevent-host-death family protein